MEKSRARSTEGFAFLCAADIDGLTAVSRFKNPRFLCNLWSRLFLMMPSSFISKMYVSRTWDDLGDRRWMQSATVHSMLFYLSVWFSTLLLCTWEGFNVGNRTFFTNICFFSAWIYNFYVLSIIDYFFITSRFRYCKIWRRNLDVVCVSWNRIRLIVYATIVRLLSIFNTCVLCNVVKQCFSTFTSDANVWSTQTTHSNVDSVKEVKILSDPKEFLCLFHEKSNASENYFDSYLLFAVCWRKFCAYHFWFITCIVLQSF